MLLSVVTAGVFPWLWFLELLNVRFEGYLAEAPDWHLLLFTVIAHICFILWQFVGEQRVQIIIFVLILSETTWRNRQICVDFECLIIQKSRIVQI